MKLIIRTGDSAWVARHGTAVDGGALIDVPASATKICGRPAARIDLAALGAIPADYPNGNVLVFLTDILDPADRATVTAGADAGRARERAESRAMWNSRRVTARG